MQPYNQKIKGFDNTNDGNRRMLVNALGEYGEGMYNFMLNDGENKYSLNTMLFNGKSLPDKLILNVDVEKSRDRFGRVKWERVRLTFDKAEMRSGTFVPLRETIPE